MRAPPAQPTNRHLRISPTRDRWNRVSRLPRQVYTIPPKPRFCHCLLMCCMCRFIKHGCGFLFNGLSIVTNDVHFEGILRVCRWRGPGCYEDGRKSESRLVCCGGFVGRSPAGTDGHDKPGRGCCIGSMSNKADENEASPKLCNPTVDIRSYYYTTNSYAPVERQRE